MVDGIKDGAAPKAVTTMTEEPARRAWEAGRATFMRNWPYAYALSQQAPKVKGKFAVAPYPAFEGGGKAAILGGHNMVISVYSKNPGVMLEVHRLRDQRRAHEAQRDQVLQGPGARGDLPGPRRQEGAAVRGELQQAVEQAKSRPVSPVYPQISEAIYKNVNEALAGQTSRRTR